MTKSKRKLTTNLCGRRIKLARVEKNMNQLELATALSEDCDLRVDQNSVSQMEKGDRFIKDFELVALAEVLDKHPMWLLFGDKVPGKYKS
ncbi:MAG: helix-turn-helix transcriptional regulator [Alphaproteobacteria bacterium]|nr:helix-turn-helix transcriptional regulator [Alphaproteobacteria bacterium]